MLKLSNITKTYAERGDNAVRALKGISLNFRPCEFVSILGPSGCGKTTLLNIIGGLDRYTDGDLVINGTSTKEYGAKDWDTYRNHSIGFVFQSYNLIPHQTILENVELSMTLGGVPRAERRKRAREALISVGLEDKLNKRPNQLSGGQMQRVSIARALVSDPDIILADEPTGALDSETGVMVMELLKEISKKRLVIMVTHNPDLANQYSDRIIKMLDGVVVDDSNPYTGTEEIIVKGNDEMLKQIWNNLLDNTIKSAPDGKSVTVQVTRSNADTIVSVSDQGGGFVPVLKSALSDECEVRSDTKAVTPVHREESIHYSKKHSSMSFLTALRLSANNLLSKKKRTTITALASSIGLIGIAVILSVSNGLQAYIDQTMMNSTSANYLSISGTVTKMPDFSTQGGTATTMEQYPANTTGIYPYKQQTGESYTQKLDEEFIAYLEEQSEGKIVDITYSYDVSLNILTKNGDEYISVSSSNWGESLHNADYLTDKYTVLASDGTGNGIPSSATEVALVVDSYNRLSTSVLDALGIAYTENEDGTYPEIKYEELLGKEFRIVFNDGWYTYDETSGLYSAANSTNYAAAYDSEYGITVKIVSVLREEENASASWLSNGIAYSPELTALVMEHNKESAVALAQVENETMDVTTGTAFDTESTGGFFGGGSTYENKLEELGYTQTPSSITIYPVDTDAREAIKTSLDAWNEEHADTDAVVEYTDMSSMMTSMLSSLVNIITYVLMAFSITSLVISSIMIAIIIYASVIERTKEIGILRSIGARKKDISHVFEAEAVLLGFLSGVAAIVITLLLNIVINKVLMNLVGVDTIAQLSAGTAVGLVALSVFLLLIASLIPSSLAAKKEPAVALRTE